MILAPKEQIRPFGFLRVYMLNREAGVSITHETSRCQWLGESMDYSTAIEAMQFLEHKAMPDAYLDTA